MEHASHHLETLDQRIAVSEEDTRTAEEITGLLRERLVDNNGVAEVFLAGSLARGTAIVPLSDIDVVCTVEATGPIEVTFQRISASLKDLPAVDEVGRGDAVLHVNLHDIPCTIDMVPLIISPETGELSLFRRDESSRYRAVRHDPAEQRRVTDVKDAKCGGLYRPTVRLFKYWNRQHNGPIPRSYLAECLAWYGLEQPEGHVEALSKVFAFGARGVRRTELPDPANPGYNVLGKLTEGQLDRVRQAMEHDYRSIEELGRSGDNETVASLLNEIFRLTHE